MATSIIRRRSPWNQRVDALNLALEMDMPGSEAAARVLDKLVVEAYRALVAMDPEDRSYVGKVQDYRIALHQRFPALYPMPQGDEEEEAQDAECEEEGDVEYMQGVRFPGRVVSRDGEAWKQYFEDEHASSLEDEKEEDGPKPEAQVVASMTWEQADVYYNSLMRELSLAIEAKNHHSAEGALKRLIADFPNDCGGAKALYTVAFGITAYVEDEEDQEDQEEEIYHSMLGAMQLAIEADDKQAAWSELRSIVKAFPDDKRALYEYSFAFGFGK